MKKPALTPSPESEPRAPPRLLLPALLLGLAALLLYLPTLGYGFVYDDRLQILSHGFIHDPANFTAVLTGRVFAMDVLDNNRPTMLLSLMLDSLIWGKSPAGYHLTSILFHAASTILLFLLAARLAALAGLERAAARPPQTSPPAAPRPRWRIFLPATAAAGLFACHPLQTEAVCCVTYREDLLATFFLLAALHGVLRFTAARTTLRRWSWGAGVILCLILTSGAKEIGAAGPFLVALLAALLVHRPPPRELRTNHRHAGTPPAKLRDWLLLTGLAFLAAGGVLAARFLLEPGASDVFLFKPTLAAASRWEVLVSLQPRIWTWNLGQLLWPVHFCADYTAGALAGIPTVPARLATLGALGLLAAGLWRNRAALPGAALLSLSLLVVANFIPIYHPMADRFLYLPMAGLALWLTATLARWWPDGRRAKILLAAVIIFATAVWGARTLCREAVWENSLTLWTQTLCDNPHSTVAANGLAYALFDNGRYADAETAWRHSLRLSGGQYADPWAGRAMVLEVLGRKTEADADLRRAVALDSRYKTAEAMRAGMVFEEPHIRRILPVLIRQQPAP